MKKGLLLMALLLLVLSLNSAFAFEDSNNTQISTNTSDISIMDDSSSVILDTNDMYVDDKGNYFDAFLCTQNGTPLANKEITFSIISLNYTMITNSNGIASLQINLNPGVYSITTSYGDIINKNTIFIRDTPTTFIDSGLTNDEIQSIIDSAKEGDTIEFIGKSYDNIYLTINKAINLISYNGATLNGISGKPIISISGNSASGTKISGLNLIGGSSAIEIINSQYVTIFNNNISKSNNGIIIDNGLSILVEKNNILNILNNAIALKNSLNTKIVNNTISNNINGIYFDEGNKNTDIYGNIISGSSNCGINLDKSGEYSNIYNNSIYNNEKGIQVNCKADDLNIEYNAISNNNYGINIGKNYEKTSGGKDLVINMNSILYNKEFNILARESDYLSLDNVGINWFGTDKISQAKLCGKVKVELASLKITQTGSGSIEVSVVNSNGAVLNVPSFTLKVGFEDNKHFTTYTISNGQGIIYVTSGSGSVYIKGEDTHYSITLDGFIPYVPPSPDTPTTNPDNPTNPTTPVNPDNNQNSGNGTFNQGSGTQGSSNSNGNVGSSSSVFTSSSSSRAQSTSSSQSTQTASESSVSSTSAGESSSSSSQSVTKKINIEDDEIVKIAGIAVIILLIIAIIGIYYRNDIKEMINKKNGN